MKLIPKSATKNVLDNTKTIMDFADTILTPSCDDLSIWFEKCSIEYKAILSLRLYIQEIFELKEKYKDDNNYIELNLLIDNIKSYFYEEKYLTNELWWNAKNFQKAILKLTHFINENPSYLQCYIKPTREMLYEISSQKKCDVSYIKLTSLKPLQKLLLLEDLSMQECGLDDISDIEHLTYLKILNIQDNNIISIQPLVHMTQLQWLGASKNKINNISAFTNMPMLEQVDFRWNNVIDISPISNLINLKILYCGVNNIESLKPVSNLKSLIILGASKNHIKSLKPLRGLENLVKILISDNEIEDIYNVSFLTNIISFDFRNNKISTMKHIMQWENIRNIGFDGNNISQDEIKEFVNTHDTCFIHNNNETSTHTKEG
jgi:internalin A